MPFWDCFFRYFRGGESGVARAARLAGRNRDVEVDDGDRRFTFDSDHFQVACTFEQFWYFENLDDLQE